MTGFSSCGANSRSDRGSSTTITDAPPLGAGTRPSTRPGPSAAAAGAAGAAAGAAAGGGGASDCFEQDPRSNAENSKQNVAQPFRAANAIAGLKPCATPCQRIGLIVLATYNR